MKEIKFVLEDLLEKAHNRVDRLGELKAHLNGLIGNTADTELMMIYRELRNKVETFVEWDIDEILRLEQEAESVKNGNSNKDKQD
jgi:hypothetical protein